LFDFCLEEDGDDPDRNWKPDRKTRSFDNDDDDSSEDETELSLLKDEAAEFVRDSSASKCRSAKKRARLNLHDDE
jgi:hypothetical protein